MNKAGQDADARIGLASDSAGEDLSLSRRAIRSIPSSTTLKSGCNDPPSLRTAFGAGLISRYAGVDEVPFSVNAARFFDRRKARSSFFCKASANLADNELLSSGVYP